MDLPTTTSSREAVGDEADASNQMPFGRTRSRRRITAISPKRMTTRRRPSEQQEFGNRCRRRGRWPTSLVVPMLVLGILLAIMPNTLRAKIVEMKEEEKGKQMREEELMKPDSQLEAIQRILLQRQKEDRTQEEEDEAAQMEGDAVHLDDSMATINASMLKGKSRAPAAESNVDGGPLVLVRSPSIPNPSRQFLLMAYDGGAPSTQAHISTQSWERYQRFKEETCRKSKPEEEDEEEYLADRALNSTESGYFHWEENEFHRQLRDRLLPQTRGGSFHSLIGSQLLSRLDPRLFASEPRSLCKAKRHVSEADERQKLAKEEQHMFEDFLINKVLDPRILFVPSRRH